MIGRDVAWRRSQECIARAAAGAGQILHVVGDAGLGKTLLARRVIAELVRRRVAVVATAAHAAQEPLAPLTELVRKVRPGHEKDLLEDSVTSGAPDALEDGKARLFERVAGALLPARGEPPLALVIENLHDADAVTRQAISALGERIARHPALLVVTERPGTALWAPRPGLVHIDLPPLDDGAMAKVLDELVVPDSVPPQARADLLRGARGNPLLLRQVVEGWAVSGIAVADGEMLRFVASRGPIELPESLFQAVADRLQHLSRSRRELLASTAWLGSVSRDRLVTVHAGGLGRSEAEVGGDLDALIDDGLLTVAAGDGTVSFVDDMVRTVATRAVPDEARLRALAARAGEEGDLPAERIAEHWLAAGQPARAVPHLLRAGDLARAAFDLGRAADAYQNAVRLAEATGQTDALTPTSFERLGDVLLTRGYHGDAEDNYRRALSGWRAAADHEGAVRCLRRLAAVLLRQGRYSASEAACEEAIALLGESVQAAELEASAAVACRYDGRLADATRRVGRGFARLSGAPDAAPAVRALLHRAHGNVLQLEGRPLAAAAAYQRGIPYCDQLGDRVERVIAAYSTGECFAEAGFDTLALQWLREVLSEHEALGHRWGIAYTSSLLGRILADRGERDAAIASSDRARDVAADLGDPRLDATIAVQRAHILVVAGRTGEATRLLEGAFQTVDRIGLRPEAIAAATGLCAARRALGDAAGAFAAIRRAIEELGACEVGAARAEALLELGLTHAAVGEAAPARTALFSALHAIHPDHRVLRDRILDALETVDALEG